MRRSISAADILLTLLVIAAFVLISAKFLAVGESADLHALWTAAEFIAAGQPDAVYVGSQGIYEMTPAARWVPHLQATGYTGQIFPYVYPPLWAALLAPMTKVVGFASVAETMAVANPLLLSLISLIAWRLSSPRLAPQTWLIVTLLIYCMSVIGAIALFQNQPQILVAFLTILAVERSLAGAPATAGVALALAAGLKIFPGLLVVLWIAQGRWREAGIFFLVVSLLATGSVGIAGWPLHEAFLVEVRAIADTLVVTKLGFSLFSLAAVIFPPIDLRFVNVVTLPAGAMQGHGWSVAPLGMAGRLGSALALAVTLVGFALIARRVRSAAQIGILWAAAVAGIALVSPLAWAYYFILPTAFAPRLIEAWGSLRGTIVLLLVFYPTNIVHRILSPETSLGMPPASLSACTMTLLTVLYVVIAMGRQNGHLPLRPRT